MRLKMLTRSKPPLMPSRMSALTAPHTDLAAAGTKIHQVTDIKVMMVDMTSRVMAWVMKNRSRIIRIKRHMAEAADMMITMAANMAVMITMDTTTAGNMAAMGDTKRKCPLGLTRTRPPRCLRGIHTKSSMETTMAGTT